MTRCSEAFASGHVKLLPVSIVAPNVYIQGTMTVTKCSEAFVSGHLQIFPVSTVAFSMFKNLHLCVFFTQEI